jgi:O-antigen ligase
MVEKRMTRIRQICGDFNFRIQIRYIRFFCVLFPFLLVFSTVFVVDKNLAQGVISGKYFWFYGSMVLTAVAVFISVLVSRRKVRLDWLDWLVGGFCMWVVAVSYFQGENEMDTTKFILLLLLLLLYFCLRIFFAQYNKATQYLTCFIILGGLAEAIWGLLQLYGFTVSQHNLFKTTGSFFNPGPYAGYLAVILPLALYSFMKATNHKVKILNSSLLTLHSITGIVILLILPATMSRAAWFAASAGCLIVITGHYSLQLKAFYAKYKKWILPGIIACILTFFIVLAGIYHLKKDSADGRLLMWKIAFRTTVEHPLGVGLGHFPNAYGEMQAAYFASGQASETEELVAGSPEYGFNEYLQIAVEAGIAGLLLFLGLIVLVIRNYLNNRQYGLAGSLVALLVFACFSYPFSVLPFLILFVFLISRKETGNKHIDAKTERQEECLRVYCLLTSIIAAYIIYIQYPVYNAYKEWDKNRVYYHSELYREVTEAYKPLYPYLNDRIQFLFEYSRSLSNTKQYEESNAVLQKAVQISCDPMLYNIMGKNYQAMKNYRQAEICFIRATQMVPNRLYPWYLLAKLYDEMGLPDKVRETAAIVLTKEPKVQSAAVREMRKEVLKLKTKS